MKPLPIFIANLIFIISSLEGQPVSWFVGAGGGITKLYPLRFTGNQLKNSGKMKSCMIGVDIPLHENMRPLVRGTFSYYNASFKASQISDLMSNTKESYFIQLSGFTTECSFIYFILNYRLKVYLGSGANIHFNWCSRDTYKIESGTWNMYPSTNNYVRLIPQWVSLNAKAGIKYERWELGGCGYLRGIISSQDFEMLDCNLYFLYAAFHFSQNR